MLLLLVPSFICSVASVSWPGDARLALARAPVLAAGSRLRPRRRAGAFAGLALAFLADVYAAVLEHQDVLDPVEGCRISFRCQRHQILRRREAYMVQEKGAKHVVAHQGLMI
eukprot:1304138-Pyramimonas_sp.AAC.1